MGERTTLDLKDLRCPLPVLRASRAVRGLAPGGELAVLATDPRAPADFRAFCESAGHTLVDVSEAGGVFAIVLRKAAD